MLTTHPVAGFISVGGVGGVGGDGDSGGGEGGSETYTDRHGRFWKGTVVHIS